MVAFNKFQSLTEDIAKGNIDLDGHTFKIALTNTAPVAASNTVLADITQISAANGYVSGGSPLQNVTVTRSGGTTSFNADDLIFTATGAMGPFRYQVLYDDTAAGKPLMGFWDRGSSVTLGDGDTAKVDFTGAIFTLS